MGSLETIEKMKRRPIEEPTAICRRNRAFGASHFSRGECLARFTKHVIGRSMRRLSHSPLLQPSFANAYAPEHLFPQSFPGD